MSKNGVLQDPLTARARGEWGGDGKVYGKKVQVKRQWSPVLKGRFLKVEMKVFQEGKEEDAFPALAFWKPLGGGAYEVVWMDASGSLNLHQATSDQKGESWAIVWTEKQHGVGQQQRLIIAFTDKNSCTEELQTEQDGSWKSMGLFTLKRTKS